MNITASTIYFWQLADRLLKSLEFISGILAIALLFSIVFLVGTNLDKGLEAVKPLARGMTWILAPCFFLSYAALTLVPSSNTIAMMVVIPKIAESKAIQQDLPDIYNAAVEALKSSLKK